MVLRFYTFASQDERRRLGGSDWIELQYCRLPAGTPVDVLLANDMHWQDDSLYLSGEEMEAFTRHYGAIFTGGFYQNGRRGPVDLCGLNYYDRMQAEAIRARLEAERPPDYRSVLRWLQDMGNAIGFYLLGL